MSEELDRNTAEVARAADLYLNGAEGMEVQDDQDAREALDDTPHTAVQNDDDGTTLNSVEGLNGAPVYDGGNVVDDEEPLEMDDLVRDALDAGDVFNTGGPISPDDYIDENSVSPYLDMMWLVEASKKTGEKFF